MNQYLRFCKNIISKTASYLVRTETWSTPSPRVSPSINLPVLTAIDTMPPKKVPSTSSGAGTSGVQHSGKKPAGKVATAKGYKRPDSLPVDFLIEDKANKRSWKIGELIGQGGFADVYAVSDHISKPVTLATAKHVLKLEPQSNGPLFQEIRFFKAAAKKESIAAFMVTHKLKGLGIMEYIGSGVLDFNDKELRWLVLPRLGQCVQKILDESGGRFSRQCIIMLALQLTDILEYIHSQGYAHGDIKAQNMMTGLSKSDSNQVYLIDFGLVKRFLTDGVHNELKEEPKAAHDGTLEFTSVDAHKGIAPSRRGDLQILGFNLIKWSVGSLPWSDSHDANFVKSQKIGYLQNVTEFFRVAYPAGETAPKELVDYFKEIKGLEYEGTPNYAKLRAIFEAAYKEAKVRKSDLFQPVSAVDAAPPPASPKKRGRKPAVSVGNDDDSAASDGDVQETVKKPKVPAASKKTVKKKAATASVEDLAANGHTVDLAKLPPGQRRKAVAALQKASEASTSGTGPISSGSDASSHTTAPGTELATTLATLPPGQRRKVKAVLEHPEDGEGIQEVLAALPAAQQRKIKAAVADDAVSHRNGHKSSSTASTSHATSDDSGDVPVRSRPTRRVKVVNYADLGGTGDTEAKKKPKKNEL